MSRKDWTKEEIELLRQSLSQKPKITYKKIQEFYFKDRSVHSIKLKASKLRFSKKAPEKWSDIELNLLKVKCKEPLFLEEIAVFFPSRTVKAIEFRIAELQINRTEQLKLAKTLIRKKEYIEKINELADKFDLEVNLDGFEDRESEFSYTCSVGHNHTTDYQKLYNSRHGCETCGKRAMNADRRYTKAQIFRKARELNLKIEIIGEYLNSNQPIPATCLICKRPFPSPTNATNIMTGRKCLKCSMEGVWANNALEIEEVREKLDNLGLKLLSDEYLNNHTDLEVKYISCGHKDMATWNELQGGRKCQVCAELKKAKPVDYEDFAKLHGGVVLAIPERDDLQAQWRCKYGHVFTRAFKHMRVLKTFCTTCTQHWGEGICRTVLECVYELPFPKVRPKGMRSPKNRPLELDCFNETLKIALEHNGIHHYKSQKNWGGDKALFLQKKHDMIREEYCEDNGIALLIVPEIGTLTQFEEVTSVIASELKKHGRDIPPKLLNLDITELEIKTSRDYYIQEIRNSAKRWGFAILGEIKGADIPIEVRCSQGHITKKTPRQITNGNGCSKCRIIKLSKPVSLSDGRIFDSRTAVAAELEVSKSTVNRAVKRGWKVKGFFIRDITRFDVD